MSWQPTHYATTQSPIGGLTLVGRPGELSELRFDQGDTSELIEDRRAFTDAIAQLDEYFSGARREFDLTLRPTGTDFQRAVWLALRKIPYGETSSYGAVASAVARPKAARAVGGANNKNPIPVIVPCHRVVGAAGALVGYGGGLERKSWLLAHEGARERNANSSS